MVLVDRTSKKRLARQSQNASNCLMSDSDSSERTYKEILSQTAVEVDDYQPAKVDLMSCDSSFSDCSLPCHELLTCSDKCHPLAEGVVKVSVRPPQDVEPCALCGPGVSCQCVPCTDRDRYNIKFVSHIVENPQRAKICDIPPFEPPPAPPPPRLASPHKVPSIHSLSPLPSPEPSSVAASLVVPSVSEETLIPPIVITEPPEVVEEIPGPPEPPCSPVVCPPPCIVTPGVIGVSGTQVVTRHRKHYGDLCKLIRCSAPSRPACPPPSPPPCPPPCDYCKPCDPCENDNQSNSCAAPCCSSDSCSDEDLRSDPCRPPCEPPPCCKPQPSCRPCCKVTWVRSISTHCVPFTQPLLMRVIEEACSEPECSIDDCDSESSSDQLADKDTLHSETGRSAGVIESSKPGEVNESRNSAAGIESIKSGEFSELKYGEVGESGSSVVVSEPSKSRVGGEPRKSGTVSLPSKSAAFSIPSRCGVVSAPSKTGVFTQVQSRRPGQNVNINAGQTPSTDSNLKMLSSQSDANVGSVYKKRCSVEKCKQKGSSYGTVAAEEEYRDYRPFKKHHDTPGNCCRCKPPNPWKRPPDMEQQTFDRYVQEIVSKLYPVIPPNPFAVQRQPCPIAEPDCERIRSELEGLLAVVDKCPPCASTCWPC